jgi:hypothetical protein
VGNWLHDQGAQRPNLRSSQHLLTEFSNLRAARRQPNAHAQSGCLTYGSLLANQRRQSAIRQSFMASRPTAPGVLQRALACQRKAARSRGIRHRCLALEVAMSKLKRIEAATTNVPRHHPKYSGISTLHRPLHIRQNLCQSTHGTVKQKMPKTKIHGKVFVFSTPSTSRPSLTVRSRGQ